MLTPSPVRRIWPLLADLGCVLALAIGGKSSHDVGESAWAVVGIGWPFALAAVLAHLALWSRGRTPTRFWPDGTTVLVTTYVLGMLLRAASGRGLAPAFLVVAALFLTATMLGWRLVAAVVGRRRVTPTP